MLYFVLKSASLSGFQEMIPLEIISIGMSRKAHIVDPPMLMAVIPMKVVSIGLSIFINSVSSLISLISQLFPVSGGQVIMKIGGTGIL